MHIPSEHTQIGGVFADIRSETQVYLLASATLPHRVTNLNNPRKTTVTAIETSGY